MRFVPLTAFTIDRWKIINLFWDSVRAGVYPYGMSTPVGNSLGASPVYFLIAYPAYATGWFELLPLSVPWIWWFGFPRLNLQLRLTGLIFIFASPIFIYEILTRSTLLFNSILIAAFCAWILSVKTWNWKIVILYGILGGLLLNTRTVFGLPIAVAMLYLIRRRELSMRIICTACMMAMTYIAVYVIFALFWSTAEVLTANPLTVQSENLYPPLFMLIMIFIATVGGLVACRKNVLLFGGVCMFIAVAAYIAIQISRHGCQAALLGKESDITYLAFCLPFILPYLTLSKKY
ncbi:MAG: hypothetical protein K2M31_03180 [Muribaculaceae bacterium]|nr:hypothetical protein [Muribaculaceae bacterium]